jgi:hypothetical protein
VQRSYTSFVHGNASLKRNKKGKDMATPLKTLSQILMDSEPQNLFVEFRLYNDELLLSQIRKWVVKFLSSHIFMFDIGLHENVTEDCRIFSMIGSTDLI